jgi:hypothetical protein
LKSFSASRYPCSDPQATGVAATVVPMFRACADLSSVSRELFSGSKFHRLEFQYSFDGSVGKWDAAPNGTQGSDISEVSFVLQCYCNRALQVTRGAMSVLM